MSEALKNAIQVFGDQYWAILQRFIQDEDQVWLSNSDHVFIFLRKKKSGEISVHVGGETYAMVDLIARPDGKLHLYDYNGSQRGSIDFLVAIKTGFQPTAIRPEWVLWIEAL